MHLLFYLFLVFILNAFGPCFFSKISKASLSHQVPSYSVSLRPEDLAGHFEDKKIPIALLISFEDENIQDNNLKIRIKNISIEGVDGHLETETGDLVEGGFDFCYKGEGYPLLFVPDNEESSGPRAITLATLLIDKHGNHALSSANCHLCICHKEVEEALKFSEALTPLTRHPFQDGGFLAHIRCNEKIALSVGGKHLLGDEAWILEDWFFENGLSGKVYDDASSSNQLTKPLRLEAGTTYIASALETQNLSGTPIMVCSLVHPDGRKEGIEVDISNIVLPILGSKLAEYKTLLSGLIYPKTDPDSRKQAINASKDILLKMGYLTGQEVKTKVASIIGDFRFFLEQNKADFKQAIRVSEIASRAASYVNVSSSLTKGDKDLLVLLREEQPVIVSLLAEVDDNPGSFAHLTSSIKSIRQNLNIINAVIAFFDKYRD